MGACAGGSATRGEAHVPASVASFEDEVAVLGRHGPVIVLADGDAGRVAVSPGLQGRVMTSAVAAHAPSMGWVNHAFLEAGRTGTQFDNYGGEDRFWLGPEGGQFGLYFAPGDPFTFAKWQTPAALNEGAWAVQDAGARRVVLARAMRVTNHAGTAFELAVERTVSLLTATEVEARLGIHIGARVQWVAFETDNRITNTGPRAWTREGGLLSVWILGMYAPSSDAHVVIPFDASAGGGPGEVVNDRYFGKVPADRLAIHEREGFLVFACDGEHRSKIGLGPTRARQALGSYSASARLLTLVQYDRPTGPSAYVNSMWEEQTDPYGGDVINSYNDGPPEPGKPSLGGFYEIETSSPAAALAPGASISHKHRTFHFAADPADLDPLARSVLHVGLDAMHQ
jgi:hypothetical protein